jgi:hypothetical protein
MLTATKVKIINETNKSESGDESEITILFFTINLKTFYKFFLYNANNIKFKTTVL